MIRSLIGLLLLWAAAATAGTVRHALDEPRFQRVGDNDSINDGVVTALAEDESGFLWVGTSVGVVRHDGYHLRPFIIGASGPSANLRRRDGTRFVRSLLAAPGGVLWVGLEGQGLARLDTATQRWTLYAPDPAKPEGLAHGTVRALALDADRRLWVGTTGGGLHMLRADGQGFERHTVASGALPDDRVQALRVDRQGSLWVGTWRGLVRRAKGAGKFEPVFSTPGADQLHGHQVSMIGEGPDGRIWVGTREGDLALVDPATGQGRWLERADPPLAETTTVAGAAAAPGGSASFVVATDGEVWIGRDRALDVRDPRTGALLQRLRRSMHKPWGLAGHNVVALQRDASGQLWVGSYGGGLQRHLPSTAIWVRRGEGPEGTAFAEGDVRSLHELRQGDIWAGTPAGAVLVFDAQLRLVDQILPGAVGAQAPGGAGRLRTAEQDAARALFAGGLVGAITQGRDDTVWVGSDSGVHAFTPQRQLLRRYPMGSGRTRRLLATIDGSIWAGTQDGVYRLAPGGAGFERLRRADGQALSGNVNALAQAADGTVWVGANAGLFRVPPGGVQLQSLAADAAHGLRSPVVLGLLVDRRQKLWIDTSAGLHRLSDPAVSPARFEHVATAAAGGGSFGANLLEDRAGRIWTHQNVFDPRDGSLQELGPADGVDNGTGWFRAYAALSDGRLLFGGSTGVLVVAPDRLVRWNYQPPVVLTELRINGERRQPQRASPALTLGPDESSFSIEFAALDYSQPERNRYRYRLEGIDANWIETGADFRVASYGSLPPGEYRLTLQGSNRLGQWSPRMLALPVVVQPAWWQTWWARGGALAAGAGAVWGLVQLRTRLLRRRQADLEAKVQQRTQALEALSEELRQKSAALEASSLTDPLTGLHNRRFLGQHMAVDTALTLRRHGVHSPEAAWPGELDALPPPGAPAASRPGATPEGASVDGPDIVFFLIDVDHFKEVNDRHGHAAGDAVLQQVSRRLKQAFREADHVVRWGGEEFLVAARGMRRELAPELAERACQAIGGEPFVLDDGSQLHRSCSVGFAAYPLAPAWPGALPWTTTVDLADAALYVVKRSGRSGWFGLQQADAADADALRKAAKQPLADWLAQGGLQVQGSRDYAAASGTTGRP